MTPHSHPDCRATAKASTGGRLSLGQDTRATLLPVSLSAREVEGLPGVFRNWALLREALTSWFRPNLHVDGQALRPLILWPAAVGAV